MFFVVTVTIEGAFCIGCRRVIPHICELFRRQKTMGDDIRLLDNTWNRRPKTSLSNCHLCVGTHQFEKGFHGRCSSSFSLNQHSWNCINTSWSSTIFHHHRSCVRDREDGANPVGWRNILWKLKGSSMCREDLVTLAILFTRQCRKFASAITFIVFCLVTRGRGTKNCWWKIPISLCINYGKNILSIQQH